MYKTRAKRDSKGRIVHEDMQSKELPSTRIQPDRRWFGNTRVVGVRQLEQFREDMAAKVHDSYAVLLRQKKLPLALLAEPKARDGTKATLLAAAPFQATFGKKATRKRPALGKQVDGYGDLVTAAAEAGDKYEERGGVDAAAADAANVDGFRPAARDAHYDKGQSRRIWAELYKVLDSSDVVVQVLDARDPDGTRCKFLEAHLKANARHKHVIMLLNKCDLVRVVEVWRGRGGGVGGFMGLCRRRLPSPASPPPLFPFFFLSFGR
jgi:nuclear GTP-binding protein